MNNGQPILELLFVTLLGNCTAAEPPSATAEHGEQAHVSQRLILATQCKDSIDSVYEMPSHLPPYAAKHRGDVVRCASDRTFSVEQIETVLAADGFLDAEIRGAVRVYRIAYRTERLLGQEGVSSALVLLPDWPLTAAPPVVVFAHGMEGIAPECTVSKGDWTTGPFHRGGTLLTLASYGYAVIAPDYAGFMPGSVPGGVLLAQDEAHSVLDGTRAMSKLLKPGATSAQVVLVGHSQGGHSVLAAQALAGSYGLSGELAGVVAFAPAWYSLQALGFVIAPGSGDNTTDDAASLRGSLPYFYTHAEVYDGPGSGLALFQPSKRTLVAAELAACATSPNPVPLEALGRTSSDFFEPAFVDAIGDCVLGTEEDCTTEPAATWLQRFRDDRPHLDSQGADIVLWQGGADPLLPPALAQCGIDRINADFSAADATATFTLCGDRIAAHETIQSRNMNWTAQWIASKTGDAPAPDACAGRSELLPEDGVLECPLTGTFD